MINVFLRCQIWAGPMTNYRVAVLLVNKGVNRVTMTAVWEDIGLPLDTVVEARDVWEHKRLKQHFAGNLTTTVASHGCKMYVLTPTEAPGIKA